MQTASTHFKISQLKEAGQQRLLTIIHECNYIVIPLKLLKVPRPTEMFQKYIH